MRALLASICVLLAGCAPWLAPVPMASRLDTNPGARARCLLVLLPGAGDRAGVFAEQGFIEAVRARRLSVDIVSADATMGYYARGMVVDRLEGDVLGPARSNGYEETWLVGVSMGGMGALLYAQRWPQQVRGVLALSPYLGPASLVEEIRAAGGLTRWTPPEVEPSTSQNYAAQLWRWLQAITVKGEGGPEVDVGWADSERLALADSLLAAVLPEDRVYRAPGRHEWATWHRLAVQWLERSTFSRGCAEVPTP